MKTPTSLFKVLIILIITISGFHISAQQWNTNGNVADTTEFIGTINAEPLRIKTDSIDRIIVGVNDSIQFMGASLFDSIKILDGFLYADSIRVRVLDIGDSNRI